MTDAPEPRDGGNAAVEEFEVLFPDEKIAVRDPDTGKPISVAVREFRFLDGLKAQAFARPLIETLAGLVESVDGGADLDPAAFEAAIGQHPEIWIALCALATGRDADWLAELRDSDSQALTVAMLEVNARFFIGRIVRQVLDDPGLASLFRCLASSTSSSGPAMGEATPKSPDISPGARSSSSGDAPRSGDRTTS